jgi:hypothetical protein
LNRATAPGGKLLLWSIAPMQAPQRQKKNKREIQEIKYPKTR